MPLAKDTIIGRYRIRDRVGGGGNGDVYRAHDDVLARDVAIKILSERAEADVAAVHQLTREARAASALNHPNIVTIYDVGESDVGPYIVMEIIEGQTVRALVSDRPSTGVIIGIGMQVARALELAHQAGIVHRDIKPENVMVRSDGVVKVLDFGLARASAPAPAQEAVTAITTVGLIVGTAAYMSPEQARGEALDSASDVFALGATLYELVARKHPFAGPDTMATLAHVLSDTPAPPSHQNPDVPPALDDLILRMLSKLADQRPSTSDVLEALARMSGGAADAAGPIALVPAVAPTVVGRDRALSELVDAFKEVEAGRGRMVAISGEAGIGKTTLVERFLAGLVGLTGRRLAMVTGRGQCSERLSGAEAYLPWLEVLGSLKDDVGRPLVETLRTLAPSWHAQIAPLSTGDSPEARLATVNRGGSQEWLKRELAVFLEETSRTKPIVLFVEDVHWADVSTVDLLSYVAARLATMKVLLLVTYRPSDAKLTQHPFLKLNVDLQSRGVCRELRVELLSRDDVERYVSMEYGAHRFPREFVNLLHARTEGHPLFVAELLRSLSERDIIHEQDGVWTLTRPPAEVAQEIPDTIRRAIELKIERIGEADRRLLVAASVQGFEFDSAIVAQASGIDQGDVEERLGELARLHALVEQVREAEHPDRRLTAVYRFAHVLYQNACYRSLGPSRRASLCGAVANALLTALTDQAPSHASELALLFEAARDFNHAAEYYLAASGRARQIFADREAALLARKGLEMLDALPKSPDLIPRELAHLMALAIPLQSIKSYGTPELGELYGRAKAICDAIGENLQLYPVLCAISAFHFVRGELRTAADLTDQVMRLADAIPVPAPRVWAEWGYGAVYSHLGENLPQAHEHLARGQALYHVGYHPAFMLATGFDPGVGCFFQDARVLWLLGQPDKAVTVVGEAVHLARKLGHPLMVQFALFFTAWVRQLRNEPALVLEVLREALPAAEEHGYAMLVGWMTALGGWAEARMGEPASGIAKIRATLGRLREAGAEILRPSFLALLADALARDGQLDEAWSALEEARELAARTHERFYEAEILRLSGELAGRVGRSDAESLELLERAVRVAKEQRALSLELRATTSLARWLAGHGRQGEAAAPLDAVIARFTGGRNTVDFLEAVELRDQW